MNNCLLTKQPNLQQTPKLKVRKILDTTLLNAFDRNTHFVAVCFPTSLKMEESYFCTVMSP